MICGSINNDEINALEKFCQFQIQNLTNRQIELLELTLMKVKYSRISNITYWKKRYALTQCVSDKARKLNAVLLNVNVLIFSKEKYFF